MNLNKLTKKSKIARHQRAVLLCAMRQHQSMKIVRTLASLQTINAVLRKYPRLHRYYRSDAAPRAYRVPKRPPNPSAIKILVERELRLALESPDDPGNVGKIELARKILDMWD